ncbi:MAG: STAS domain-containing protein [Parafilimonas sp.]
MVKIDTREKFTVITPNTDFLSDSLTEKLSSLATSYLTKDIKNIVLNMAQVSTIDENVAHNLSKLQQQFYTANGSFVLCEVKPEVVQMFEKLKLADAINITPTESEAWDIVQMEEIEREFLNDEDAELGGSG